MDNSYWIAYATGIFLVICIIIYRLLEHRQVKQTNQDTEQPFPNKLHCPRCDIEMHFINVTTHKCMNCGKIAEIDLVYNALRFREETNVY
jgi:hypothetical protein